MEKNERNNQEPNKLRSPGHGPQGIDKAPGEEPAQDNVNFVAETQKGKQQVDADVDREQDRAIDQQDL
ncbi:hypothetical protein EPD60_14245 [Flaviaesturariibacter flavus]|uniref:Uncharacterized protein n=1 Tax=Flaviaesturariibacter flavus TaxID=2502780 RepID=A0A4R1B8H5_9BACT|nr:hypothetical protein [Flaviaesturariibacter flavus]TCJ12433.1 hypothetical protein EPD60_14245 [Flaviaesturariibacter flavus]